MDYNILVCDDEKDILDAIENWLKGGRLQGFYC